MEKKKRISFLSLLIIVICISLCIGLTYAYFTDSATSSGNKIQAGKLKIDFELLDKGSSQWHSIKESQDPIFNYEYWEPGYTDVKILKVENEETLAIKWEARFIYGSEFSALANVIEVFVKTSDNEFAYPAGRDDLDESWKSQGTLASFATNISTILNGELLSGESDYFGIALYMPTEVDDNDLQGQSIDPFDIQIVATQLASESDALGPDYDDDATFPCNHAEYNWVIDVWPTYSQKGSKLAKCTACGEIVKTVEVDYSKGLVYALVEDEDGIYYEVADIGTCEDVEIIIPATYKDTDVCEDELPVKAIGWAAFSYAEFTGVAIPNSITTIRFEAFWSCANLTKIVIPDSVTLIDSSAFCYCTGLTEVILPDSVTEIHHNAFRGCDSLKTITIPETVTLVSSFSFYGCQNLEEIVLPDSVTNVGPYAFEWCPKLTSVTIGSGVAEIGFRAFGGCPELTSITISEGNTTFCSINNCIIKRESNLLLYGCNGSIIPDGITAIGEYAFAGCDELTAITIPDGVTFIGELAFDSCTNLTSVVIPDSVTTIQKWAFSDCGDLIIFCRAESAPDGWNEEWNLNNYPVLWGWTGEEQTYIFETYGGSIVDSITSTVSIDLPTTEKDGMYFGGWYDNADFDGIPVKSPYYSSTKRTLYAKWLTEREFHAGESFDNPFSIKTNIDYTVDIKTNGQKIYCIFTPTVDGKYTFLSNGMGSEYARLYNSDKMQINSSNADYYGYFFISQTMAAGETYYLEVGDMWNGIGSFTLTVTKEKTLEESLEQAETINLYTSYVVDVAKKGQNFYYKFTPTADGIYTFRSSGWGTEYIRIYDSNKTIIASGDADYNGYFLISKTMTAGETYYLEVGDMWEGICYFTFTIGKEKTLDEYFEEAEALNLDISYGVSIATSGQKLYYKFTPTEDGVYTFRSSGYGTEYARLYDSNQNPITVSNADANGYFSIARTMTAGETYYLEVGDMWNGTCSFTFSVVKR